MEIDQIEIEIENRKLNRNRIKIEIKIEIDLFEPLPLHVMNLFESLPPRMEILGSSRRAVLENP